MYPEYPDYEEMLEREEIDNVIKKYIDNKVAAENELILKRNEYLQERLDKSDTELRQLKEDYKLLQTKLDNQELADSIVENINIENINNFFGLIGLKRNEYPLDIGHVDSEYLEEWFKIYWNYYPDREKVIKYFEYFDIEFDKDIKNFIAPWDLGEEFLIEFVKDVRNRYIVNSNNFKDNGASFFMSLRRNKYNVENILGGGDYNYIPFQHVFRNKLITSNKVFSRIVSSIKNKESHSNYFYNIMDYQKLSDEQALELANSALANNHNKILSRLLSNHPEVLNMDDKMLQHAINNTSEYGFGSDIHYKYLPQQMQIDFIYDKFKTDRNLYRIIKDSSLTKENKVILVDKITEYKKNELLERTNIN